MPDYKYYQKIVRAKCRRHPIMVLNLFLYV